MTWGGKPRQSGTPERRQPIRLTGTDRHLRVPASDRNVALDALPKKVGKDPANLSLRIHAAFGLWRYARADRECGLPGPSREIAS
jgi:hypothetical protein